jgi:hypothetical protein
MAFLYLAMYGNTNSQEILGSGATNQYNTGSSNSTGMRDTDKNNPFSSESGKIKDVYFWGLEHWYGAYAEHMLDIKAERFKESIRYKVTEEDGSEKIYNGNYLVTGAYANKMIIGENLYALGKENEGSSTTGYCDSCVITLNGTGYTNSWRSSGSSGDNGIFHMDYRSVYSYTSRLCFKGNIIIEEDPSVYQSLKNLIS